MKRSVFTENGRGHESGARLGNSEPGKACFRVWQIALELLLIVIDYNLYLMLFLLENVKYLIDYNRFYGELVLAEVSYKNGVGVHVYEQNKVVESFFVGGLWFVVFDNGKCVIEGKAGGKVVKWDGSDFELVKLE